MAVGQDKGGKEKERPRGYAAVNIRHPPPPPTSGSATAAAASSSSSSSTTVEDDRAKGRGSRPLGDERAYDHPQKQRGRQGAEKVYELLSKHKSSSSDKDRDRDRDRAGQSPASTERQISAPADGAAVYAKPKRHAPHSLLEGVEHVSLVWRTLLHHLQELKSVSP